MDEVHAKLRQRQDDINKRKKERTKLEYERNKRIIFPILLNVDNFKEERDDSLACVITTLKTQINPKVACQVAKDLGFDCTYRMTTMEEYKIPPHGSIVVSPKR